MRIRIRSAASLLPAALALATAVSCGSGGGPARPSEYAASVPVPTMAPSVRVADPRTGVVGDVRLPLDAYTPTPDQKLVLDNARIALENSCIHRFGFSETIPPKKSPPSFLAHINAGLFGPTDVAVVKVHGYRVPDPGGGAGTSAQNPPQLSDAVVGLLTGTGPGRVHGMRVPAGGCVGEALRALSKGGPAAPNDTSYANNLAASLGDSVDKDPRVLEVQRRWSSCMKSQGYSYESSIQAMGDSRWQGRVPSRIEIDTALADVECKRRVDLEDIGIAAWVAYENEQIKAHSAQLDTYLSWLRNALGNARSLANGTA
ncbi:hypothetical protein ACIQGZ_17940 [Streptomyces sp. NPDC092296]|uniref:hypothetical protein n=1 Tax=Streptomyces sp. NPDC092296 TaxID=3366012 RepID=UPI0038120138